MQTRPMAKLNWTAPQPRNWSWARPSGRSPAILGP